MLIQKQTCIWKGILNNCAHYIKSLTHVHMYLSSFHNKLKTVYLNGKVNRRIDVLLDLLLKVEHDSFFQYELKHRLLQPNKVTFRIEDAHKRGMSISPKKVNVRKYEVHMFYSIIN